MSVRLRASVLVALIFASATPAVAQAVVRQPVRAQPLRPPGDSAVADSARPELVRWIEMDSLARALLERAGFVITRYQGDRVILESGTRTLQLEGRPAAVSRAQTLVVGDTIVYNDSTQLVFVRGDTNILRDPQQNTADVVTHGSLRYDIGRGRGTVTNISTAMTSGEQWFVQGSGGFFVRDTAGVQPTTFYVRAGSFTTCDDSIPDYHFRAREIKLISRNFMVARPAVLYIGDVPVMWLPFIFQDIRSGRRSGLLTPRFGVSELIRNSPTYRRHIDNLGYYFALSDYLDAQLWLDWRSGARSSVGDPGWARWNGEVRYRWLNRFLTGRLAAAHTKDQNASTNTAISWQHQQNFSQTRSLTATVNYVTNTTLQRQNTFDPRQVLATINSQVNYQQQVGPASIAAGATRTQYPGRGQIEQTLPTLSVTVPTLALARWLEWTPLFNIENRQSLKLDQAGTVGYRFFDRAGTIDSALVSGDRRETTASFSTPFKIFGFTWQNSFRVSDRADNYPTSVIVTDPSDSTFRETRAFPRTYQTGIDWETSLSLPSLFSGTWNLTPSIGIRNADPGPFWVRSVFTGGRFVHQSKRLDYGVSVAPTLFALLPGFGPIARFRHSLSPRLSYSYSPASEVNREFLRASNRTAFDYLGGLAQNQVTLNLSHVLEVKLRDAADTLGTGEGQKLRLFAMNFSPLSYDFERKRETGKSGFTTPYFNYDVTSDLLPGFNLGVSYSLFQGSPLSDSAVFKPFREGISASFTVNQQSALWSAVNRIFARVVQPITPQTERLEPSPDDALAQRIAATPVAGSQRRDQQFAVPTTAGWTASVAFAAQRQRPPVGGNVIDFDPAENCRPFFSNPIIYNQCLIEQQTRPTTAVPFTSVVGSPFVRTPPRETLQWTLNFHVTPKWSAVWGTTYDFQAAQFASHQVTLQRELHDWRSNFAFTKAPNGNFAFMFFISLIAQPDLKFNYDKQTYRPLTRPPTQ